MARTAPRIFSTIEDTGNLNPVTIARENYRCRLCHLTPRFSASSVDTVRVSREGQPGVVEIALDQLTPQSVARVFSVIFFLLAT